MFNCSLDIFDNNNLELIKLLEVAIVFFGFSVAPDKAVEKYFFKVGLRFVNILIDIKEINKYELEVNF